MYRTPIRFVSVNRISTTQQTNIALGKRSRASSIETLKFMNSFQYKLSYSKVASQDNMWKQAYRTWEERRSSKSFVIADRSRLVMGKLMVGLVTWHKNSERELAYYHWYSSVIVTE